MTLLIALTDVCAAKDSAFEVRGLEKPAEIIVDEWGVPHIYAGTHYDAFFVQGFNAARDRLWQIDTWRRRGLGQLSEVFGIQYLEQDRATRLFLYRGDMYREWLAYGSDAKRIAQAFTAGINAYIDLLDEHPQQLPPEFALLEYSPAHWDVEDVVRIRGHGLWGNVIREVQRARIACAADLKTANYWWQIEPEWTTQVPDGLDPCVIPENVLDVYALAKAPVVFDRLPVPQEDATADHEMSSVSIPVSANAGRGEGSNNWTVSPARTSTGRPILADDPHRGHAVPSLRYIAHLVAPGLDVIGAGEPALPGISIGHNDRIAFGLTIFPIDQEDLYVYRKANGRYQYGEGLEDFRTIIETVQVRNNPPESIELKFTRHGPVVFETEDHVFVVRAAWLEPGMAPYFGSVEYMRASNWREFSGALNRWGAPSENQVYADVDGNIGYKPAGLFPRRGNWDGLLPVPGDGRYEWNGFFDMDVLPSEFNPERGFTGTANSMNLPDGYPIEDYPMGFEWAPAWRYDRLWEVLQSQPDHSLQDSNDLQRDYQSLLAKEAIRRLPDGLSGPAADMLRDWNGVMAANSAAGALFALWFYRHLSASLAQVLLPETPELVSPLGSKGILLLMNEARGRVVIQSSLEAAYAVIIGSRLCRGAGNAGKRPREMAVGSVA
jgi:penicillin amidase